MSKNIKLFKLACGKHYGKIEGNECSKCKYFAEYRHKNRKHLQYDGTPWIALINP